MAFTCFPFSGHLHKHGLRLSILYPAASDRHSGYVHSSSSRHLVIFRIAMLWLGKILVSWIGVEEMINWVKTGVLPAYSPSNRMHHPSPIIASAQYSCLQNRAGFGPSFYFRDVTTGTPNGSATAINSGAISRFGAGISRFAWYDTGRVFPREEMHRNSRCILTAAGYLKNQRKVKAAVRFTAPL